MRPFVLPILFVVIALSFGCSSLPSHPETTGAVVLALQFDNTSAQSEPIHKVDLVLSNGHTLNFVPGNGKVVIPVTEAGLKVVGVRIALRLENWHGTDHTAPVSLPLDAEPGQIRILPWIFAYHQENYAPKPGSYWGRWNLIPQTPESAEAMAAALRSDPEFARWTLVP